MRVYTVLYVYTSINEILIRRVLRINFADAYNGTIAVEGYPFDYLLRDVLEFDVDLAAALTRIYGARRTCPVYVGLGDGHLGASGQLRTLEYSHDYVNVYSDRTYPDYPGECLLTCFI